jgi:heme-degrading monooxygenase HmoA
MIAETPEPPYYAVIFTSERTEGDNGYAWMSIKMMELAVKQEGFLGVETAREKLGITVSYWRDMESIRKWRDNTDHILAREKGREIWYKSFTTRIAKVERQYRYIKNNLED